MSPAHHRVLSALLAAALGCSHAVKPTDRYRDAASIPTPTDVTATQSAGAILLSWGATASVFEIVDGWNVYRKTSMDAPAARVNASLVTDVLYRDTAVVEGQSYYYSVRSVSPAGVESRGSHDLEIRYDSVPPVPPEGLAATPRINGIELAWTASGAIDLGWYSVYRDGTLLASGVPQPSYLDMPLGPGLSHVYEVSASDDRGNESARSTPVAAASLPGGDSEPPAAPVGVTATATAAGVLVSWSAAPEVDLTGYFAYRRSAGVQTFARVPGTGLLSGTSLLDALLQNGTTYDYAVSAVDSSGNESALSAPATVRWVARVVDTGGSSLGSVYPWCGIAYDSGRMQFLVPAADVGRSGTIDTLALWIRSGAAIYSNVTVTLAHTVAPDLMADMAANRTASDAGTTVFGPATVDTEGSRIGSALPIPLSAPFAYDGARNLLVEVSWNGDDNRTAIFGFGPAAARLRLWQQPDGGGSSGYELNQQFVRVIFAP